MPTKRLYSRIKRYFSEDLYMKIYRLIYANEITNNEKVVMIQIYLQEAGIPYISLGPGTNRYAVLIDQVAFKFALDKDGMIDNRREIKYSQVLQPYVVKCYECVPNGLIMACERVRVMDQVTFNNKQGTIKNIISDIVKQGFLVGDIGLSNINYTNWGVRLNGEVCCLDFAYIYDVTYNVFRCSCDGRSFLEYDDRFVNLVCPTCHKVYRFGEVRKKITRKAQDEEIGDIRVLSYNLTDSEEYVEVNEEFSPKKVDPFAEEEEDEYEKNIREAKEAQREYRESLPDYDYPPSLKDLF